MDKCKTTHVSDLQTTNMILPLKSCINIKSLLLLRPTTFYTSNYRHDTQTLLSIMTYYDPCVTDNTHGNPHSLIPVIILLLFLQVSLRAPSEAPRLLNKVSAGTKLQMSNQQSSGTHECFSLSSVGMEHWYCASEDRQYIQWIL